MPVFLHQNVIIKGVTLNETLLVTHSHGTPVTGLLQTSNVPLANNTPETVKAETYATENTKENSYQSQHNSLHEVVKTIFESSVAGGEERHRHHSNEEPLPHESARIGALFSSKAFVQLAMNPVVGMMTEKIGYRIPFIFGTAVLFVSAFSKL